MIIRREQMIQLERDHARRFHSNLIVLLRTEFDDRCRGLSDEDLLTEIEPTATRCRSTYKIREEAAITKFVYLAWLLGDDFDSLPIHGWITDILRQDRRGTERLEIVMSGVIHHLENHTGMLRLKEDSYGQRRIAA